MFTTGSVAGLALQARERCAFVTGYGVPGLENREYGVLVVLVMALEAGIRTTLGIFTLLDGLYSGPGILNGHTGLGFPGMQQWHRCPHRRQDNYPRKSSKRACRHHPFLFYEKLGYVVTGVMPDANGRGLPDIYMSKSIGR